MLAGVVLFLVLRASPHSNADTVTRAQPQRSDVTHLFTKSYTGTVWVRMTPTDAHVGDDHRVRLRWGPIENSFVIKRLSSGSRTFLLQKADREDVKFFIKADPPARIDFGEGDPPRGATQEVPAGWTKRTSG